MNVGRVKFWVPHLTSWRKCHCFIYIYICIFIYKREWWLPSRWAGFDDQVKDAFTFFNKCLASDSEMYLFIN